MSRFISRKMLLLVALAALSSGCGGGGGSNNNVTPSDSNWDSMVWGQGKWS